MSDLISRCELFNRLASVEKSAEVVNIINGMPTAQQWIQMSERLPEKDGRYLCSYGKHIHITQMINRHFRHYGEIADHLISAWMPLPEPYGGDADG